MFVISSVKILRRSKRFYFTVMSLFVTLALSCALVASEWTVLVYVQAKNNLGPFALKNFSDMASIGSNDQVTMLVQWYQMTQQGIWRYKVEKGKMVLEECNPVDIDGCSANDLVDSMRWAVTKFPAQKYSLVLWDHGIGILDPLWGKTQPWRSGHNRIIEDESIIANNPRIQIDGLTIDKTMTFTKQLDMCVTTTQSSQRGILFNEQSKTYMNNQNLIQALNTIKTSVLNNKKIDLLGMDACLMAMLEVGYLARQYASVLVASQEVELANGWNYAAFMGSLSCKNTTAITAAQTIVGSYGAFYKDKIQFYTQSAINLDLVSQLKDNLNTIVTNFRACQQYDKAGLISLAKKARQQCQQFSAVNYVDLHSFYSELFNVLGSSNNQALVRSRACTDLKNVLTQGMRLVEQAVIANAAGSNLTRARGLSIYFPVGSIDASYPMTDFARESLWVSFVKELNGIAA